MRAMRDRIALQSATLTDDGHGGKSVSWSTVATVWCEWLEAHGAEFYQAGGMQNLMRHRARLHVMSAYTPTQVVKMRVIRQPAGPTCEVIQCSEDSLHRFWDLQLIEVD